MHWVVLAGAYIILWFLTLQILLPIGIKTAHDSGEILPGGTDPGAPAKAHLRLKLILATIIAAAVWAVFYVLVLTKVVDV
jgi:predicted secreted protein